MSIWWNNWADFWAMGKHGVYVWGSYGVAALLLVAEIWQARRARQQALQEVRLARLAADGSPGEST
jgi:heme exporter protein D